MAAVDVKMADTKPAPTAGASSGAATAAAKSNVSFVSSCAPAAPASSSSSSSSSASASSPSASAASSASTSSSSSSSSSSALAKRDPAIEAAVTAGTLLKQGAEARVYVGTWLGRKVIAKERFSKQYRHPALDAKLTEQRLATEVRCMVKCRAVGVACPALYYVDAARTHRIVMEFVEGQTLREVLESAAYDLSSTAPADVARVQALGALVGRAIYGLHSAGVVHGDLTSSNMIVRTTPAAAASATGGGDAKQPSSAAAASPSQQSIVMIDFGLAFVTQMIEDRAVDLYVLERALLSTHPHSQQLFDAILTAYHATKKDSTKVIEKLHAVRMRGRKRSMLG